MPYKIQKRGNKWVLINRITGKVHKSKLGKVIYYNSRANALAAARAIMASEHNWEPKKI